MKSKFEKFKHKQVSNPREINGGRIWICTHPSDNNSAYVTKSKHEVDQLRALGVNCNEVIA